MNAPGVNRMSPALQYAKDKSLTTRRSRSAMLIDAFLLRSRDAFLRLMRCDESALRRVTDAWPLAPGSGGFRPCIRIGQHALLAYPGCLIESIEESEKDRSSRVRLLIKAADEGVIFNLRGVLATGDIDWDWSSMERTDETIRDECIKRLLERAKQLVRIDIPALVAKVDG